MFSIKSTERTPNSNVGIYVDVIGDMTPPACGHVGSASCCSIASRHRMNVSSGLFACADTITFCAYSCVTQRNTKSPHILTIPHMINLRPCICNVDKLLRGSQSGSLSLK
jgi:hypothetical protein